jgi:EPS-associated MarR family transcriptional regulator
MNEDIRHKILKLLSENPKFTQRDLAKKLGVSVGKINYCMAALISKGWIKIQNFKTSENRRAYSYVLTLTGMEKKISLTIEFLKIKMNEYENIKREINELEEEIMKSNLERK